VIFGAQVSVVFCGTEGWKRVGKRKEENGNEGK
jgi:hypothetical protein